MTAIKRAISIRQPWAELILRGMKKKEDRDVPTRIRERVYLYASLRPADSAADWRRIKKSPGQLPAGKIVGTVEVVDCRGNDRFERYEYHLARPKRLQTPRIATNRPNPIWWRPRFL